jgi:flagellar motor switch protein FliM
MSSPRVQKKAKEKVGRILVRETSSPHIQKKAKDTPGRVLAPEISSSRVQKKAKDTPGRIIPHEISSSRIQKKAKDIAPRILAHDGRRIDGEVNRREIEAYDFRQPTNLRQGEVKQLEEIHESFAEHLSARMSIYLRTECGVRLAKFSTETYGRLAEAMTALRHVTLFQLESLRGIGLVEMTLPIGMTIAERLLGGRGKRIESARPLTEIETAMVDEAVETILAQWMKQWPDHENNFEYAVIGHETSGKYLQSAEPDDIYVAIELDVTIGECEGTIRILAPHSMLEPAIKVINEGRAKAMATGGNVEWRRPFNGINVPVVAEWVVRDMAIAEIIGLRPGDVLHMNREMIDRTHVRLSNAPGFIGTAGVEDGHVAVQLTQRQSTE